MACCIRRFSFTRGAHRNRVHRKGCPGILDPQAASTFLRYLTCAFATWRTSYSTIVGRTHTVWYGTARVVDLYCNRNLVHLLLRATRPRLTKMADNNAVHTEDGIVISQMENQLAVPNDG